MIKPLLLSAALSLPLPALAQEIPLAVVDTSGNLVCNEAGAYSALPGYPGYFIGRVLGTPTKSWCAGVNQPVVNYATLGIFQLNVAKRQMVLQYGLVTMPATFNGTYVRTIYDPSVMVWNGELWIAAECTPHTPLENVSACVMPLVYSGGTFSLDASRFSVPVQGDHVRGASASVPLLVNWDGSALLYWVNDHYATTTSFPLITRGAFLSQDGEGRFWVPGSEGVSVLSTTPTIVADVDLADPTSNYVNAVRALYPAAGGAGYYVVATRGGSGCSGPSVAGNGCGRMVVTFSPCPLGYDVLSTNLQPTDKIPVNTLDYPKPLVDPVTGTRYLSASFYPASGAAGYAPAVPQANTALLPWPSDLP